MEQKHDLEISIWFFIGVLLVIYGVLILGAGIYDLFYPPSIEVVLAKLHASLWWGAVILVMGIVYTKVFMPHRSK